MIFRLKTSIRALNRTFQSRINLTIVFYYRISFLNCRSQLKSHQKASLVGQNFKLDPQIICGQFVDYSHTFSTVWRKNWKRATNFSKCLKLQNWKNGRKNRNGEMKRKMRIVWNRKEWLNSFDSSERNFRFGLGFWRFVFE